MKSTTCLFDCEHYLRLISCFDFVLLHKFRFLGFSCVLFQWKNIMALSDYLLWKPEFTVCFLVLHQDDRCNWAVEAFWLPPWPRRFVQFLEKDSFPFFGSISDVSSIFIRMGYPDCHHSWGSRDVLVSFSRFALVFPFNFHHAQYLLCWVSFRSCIMNDVTQ